MGREAVAAVPLCSQSLLMGSAGGEGQSMLQPLSPAHTQQLALLSCAWPS